MPIRHHVFQEAKGQYTFQLSVFKQGNKYYITGYDSAFSSIKEIELFLFRKLSGDQSIIYIDACKKCCNWELDSSNRCLDCGLLPMESALMHQLARMKEYFSFGDMLGFFPFWTGSNAVFRK